MCIQFIPMLYFQHIVVLRKGVFYKVNVYSPRNRPVPPQVLEKQFQSILEDAEAHQGIGTFSLLWGFQGVDLQYLTLKVLAEWWFGLTKTM